MKKNYLLYLAVPVLASAVLSCSKVDQEDDLLVGDSITLSETVINAASGGGRIR